MKKEESLPSCPKLIMKQSEQPHQLPLTSPQPNLKMPLIGNKRSLNLAFCKETISIFLKKFSILSQILREKLLQKSRKQEDSLLLSVRKMKSLSTNLPTIAHKEGQELEVKDNFEQESLFSRICSKSSKKAKGALILTHFTSKESRLDKIPSASLDSRSPNVPILIFSGQ